MDLLALMRGYAQDHYWTDSWDALLRWTDAQLQTALGGAKTRRGAIRNVWQVVREIDRHRNSPLMIQTYGPRPVRAVSLFTMLAAAGGLAPHPELAAILDGPQWIGGYGPLVRRGGMALDDARAMAVQAGYLPDTAWSGGVATSTINELLDALSDEARGRKCYPFGEAGEEPEAFADDDPANYAEESCYDDVPF